LAYSAREKPRGGVDVNEGSQNVKLGNERRS